ncbi:MAG: 3-phosphoshikimate 1-carboxyvinyltransferase [Acidobacteria bacterium]|nr:MAG: 3-phosphoshikimate 1-carboxyvinyltransferase [Acidobacteriota bacterium]
MDLALTPARNFSGAVRPPGDKSLSHRCALLAALAEGSSKLSHYATGADCQSTLACLAALGVGIEHSGPEEVAITGAGLRGLHAPSGPLNAGNSGTTLRMLSGILAAQPFAAEISGDASLCNRPMRRVLQPLRLMGAQAAAAPNDRPPLTFAPAGGLHGIDYALPVASAQVKSALLLAGLYATGVTRIVEPQPTRDHTELLLRHLGVPVEQAAQPRAVSLAGPVERLAPLGDFRIPGDPSSAAFFLCATAAIPGADLLVDGISLNPTRSTLLDVLRRLGARPEVVSIEEHAGELMGSLHLDGPEFLTGTRIAGAEAVALIDEIPILAVLATRTREGIEFADVGELRVKESDRLAAITHNLRAMGGVCEERPEALFVPGGQKLHGAELPSYGDHRIAMAFAVAALLASGDSRIQDAGCASISYPEFYSALEHLVER